MPPGREREVVTSGGNVARLNIDAGYKPLRELVRNELRQRIIDGVYPAGTRLIEKDLAEQLGVSRVPIREALRALETEGFLHTLPRKGVEVVQLSERDVGELFDVRQALEALACEQAAQQATSSELRPARAAIERAQKALNNNDKIALGAANEAFHEAILDLSHNTLLRSVLEPVHGRLRWLIRQIGDPHYLIEEHAQILDAIASRNPQLAAERARAHARLNRDIVLKLVAAHPNPLLDGDGDRSFPERRS
jgi:DNA-binding GntR family transcriptional regulator